MRRGIGGIGSATAAILVAATTAYAQTPGYAPPPGYAPQEAAGPPPEEEAAGGYERRVPGELQELGVSVGAIDYTENNVGTSFYPGGTKQPGPFLTRGGWLAVQGELLTARWFAIAMRARGGWLDRAPPTQPDPDLVPGTDTSSLDPQLGDAHVGGSVAAVARFLPGHTALDAGVTVGFGSFRQRLQGGSLPLGTSCGDCYSGQAGFVTQDFWPTLRVSRTGRGFFFAVGTGEGFVRADEPTWFELLFGWRSDGVDFMGGIANGFGGRVDAHVSGPMWLSGDLSYKPWGKSAPDATALDRVIGVTSLTERWSSFAPF